MSNGSSIVRGTVVNTSTSIVTDHDLRQSVRYHVDVNSSGTVYSVYGEARDFPSLAHVKAGDQVEFRFSQDGELQEFNITT